MGDGPELWWAQAGEQEALLEVGNLRRVPPVATIGLVVGWLDERLRAWGPSGTGAAAGGGTASGGAAGGATARDGLARAAGPGAPAPGAGKPPSAVLPVVGAPGGTVVERVRWFGPTGLFGIETEAADPAGSAGSERLPVVVLLSSGTDSHVGPSRLWVRLARGWAAAGIARCVRVDLSGWGESPAHPGRPECVLRPVEAFDDVREVLAAIGHSDRVVLVGLCSGAYQALESALEVMPAAVLAVNPLLRFTPPELVETGCVSPRRRICDPKQPWVHSVRSKLPRSMVHRMASVRSAASRLRFARRVAEGLGALVEAGVRVYCICGEDNARPLVQVRRRAREAWLSSGLVRIDVVPDLDHALLPLDQREEVCDRLTGELRRITAVLAATAPGHAVAGRAVVGTP